jgi:hypothetical protein
MRAEPRNRAHLAGLGVAGIPLVEQLAVRRAAADLGSGIRQRCYGVLVNHGPTMSKVAAR